MPTFTRRTGSQAFRAQGQPDDDGGAQEPQDNNGAQDPEQPLPQFPRSEGSDMQLYRCPELPNPHKKPYKRTQALHKTWQ